MKASFTDFATLAPQYFRPAPGQVSADLAGEIAILNTKTGIYFGLDPVGARIWSLVLQGRSVEQMRDMMLEEYDVEPAQLEGDLAHLLAELEGKGLIELGVAPPLEVDPLSATPAAPDS